eukprot:TRINITY_DN10613_c0_g1_i5.p1 TRINITY_DN10613_c0_g1~~TRINITY_DN10613_c0_g1_i5.p1  ORF type:complete len:578 (+),score=123.71 TRINITY_DN10613_c0_g1_i5:1225-2958(+)
MQRVALSAGLRPLLRQTSCIRLAQAYLHTPNNKNSDESLLNCELPIDYSHPPHSNVLNFDDTKTAFQNKSLLDLMLAYAVFTACKIPLLVNNADTVYKSARKVFGATLVDGVVKRTFFKHFCGGEDEHDLTATTAVLNKSGIGAIMDYAAEADLTAKPEAAAEIKAKASARAYDYVSEAECDANLKNFMTCIDAVDVASPGGIVAVKVTALGLPDLLERIATAITRTQWLFSQFDVDQSQMVTEDEFTKALAIFFPDLDSMPLVTLMQHAKLTCLHIVDMASKQLFQRLDIDANGEIDYIEWTHNLNMEDVWNLIRSANPNSPVAELRDDMPDEAELQLLRNLLKRLDTLVAYADGKKIRLMIDAEQTYFQPAIDNVVLGLQRKFNKNEPVVYNTYQCYLKDAVSRIRADTERARREGWWFACKLVRGAYMEQERSLASKRGYDSPICESLEDTHYSYNQAMSVVLDQPRANLLVASHNQESIEFAISEMERRNIDKKDGGVCFAQLLGMCDHLTYTLGTNGYKAFKYVPYGPVNEVMPYLIRRAHENSSLLGGGGAQRELSMLASEIKRRIVPSSA